MRYSEQFMEHIEYAFAAFCRTVLRNAAISAYRDFGRKQKREVSLDYLMCPKRTLSRSRQTITLSNTTFQLFLL